MNPAAERLTGWQFSAAEGVLIRDVMRFENAASRQPEENPVPSVVQDGKMAILAKQTHRHLDRP